MYYDNNVFVPIVDFLPSPDVYQPAPLANLSACKLSGGNFSAKKCVVENMHIADQVSLFSWHFFAPLQCQFLCPTSHIMRNRSINLHNCTLCMSAQYMYYDSNLLGNLQQFYNWILPGWSGVEIDCMYIMLYVAPHKWYINQLFKAAKQSR